MNRNAVIMAAGMSTRLVPLSLETPKALLKVKNQVLIERQIEQLREAGVEEIVVVVGYLKEQFSYLKDKYGVILIENPYYQVRNNHSTLFVVRDFLRNTFICSGDNYFVDNVFKENYAEACYASVYASEKTEEWCLDVGEDGRIRNVRIGGEDSWIMKGHVYFTEKFSKKLIPLLEKAMEDEDSKEFYWEDLYIKHIEEMNLYIKKFHANVIQEFDDIEELRRFDAYYREHSGSRIMANICEKFRCGEQEINKIKPVKSKGIVTGFTFEFNGERFKYDVNGQKLTEL